MRAVLSILFAGITAVRVAAAQAPAPIHVFVTSIGAADGFTDPNKDNEDSVRDLKQSLRGRKAVSQTDVRADAAIVIVITGRERLREGFRSDPTFTIHAVFSINGRESPLTGSIRGELSVWRRAADKLGDQIEAWVTANRARLSNP